MHRVLLSRALPRHLVTGDVLRHHAGSVHLELEGGEAVQMISRKDTQGTAGDSASAPSYWWRGSRCQGGRHVGSLLLSSTVGAVCD